MWRPEVRALGRPRRSLPRAAKCFVFSRRRGRARAQGSALACLRSWRRDCIPRSQAHGSARGAPRRSPWNIWSMAPFVQSTALGAHPRRHPCASNLVTQARIATTRQRRRFDRGSLSERANRGRSPASRYLTSRMLGFCRVCDDVPASKHRVDWPLQRYIGSPPVLGRWPLVWPSWTSGALRAGEG